VSGFGDDPAKPFDKQIEKVKADNEKLPEKIKPENEKQIEKIKADNEKLPEKVKPENEKQIEKIKPDNEKLREKFHPEKHFKGELKELKHETKENPKIEKVEIKELKIEKHEIKELEIPPDFPNPDPGPLSPEQLAQHADALESAAKQLRHFIAESERPDLSQGALRDEPDAES
jgi:predicted RNase H-like nuclease (RuvC/YqgF family)